MQITHRFVDQASGATLARPGLQQALQLARQGAFDVLLVYRIDRLTRSIVGLMTIVEQLETTGIALTSATEPIDTQGPVGRMLLQLLGIFAEFERNLLIDRITAGFERKAARGEWLSGRTPYGYNLDSPTKTLTPNTDEAAVVHAVFLKYTEQRLGATSIAHWLNDTGRRTKYSGLWTGQTILRLLRNPVYIGKVAHHDTIHDGKHQPIIDPELFHKAQTLLAQRSSQHTQRPAASDYLLSGLMRCTSCTGAYVGAGAHGRNGYYRYYLCRTRQTKGANACQGQRLPADDLEQAVLAALLDTYNDLDLFEQAITTAQAAADQDTPRLEQELASTQAQLHDTTAAIDRYLRAFETGTMPDTACAPRVQQLSNRQQELINYQDQLLTQLNTTHDPTPPRHQLQAIGTTIRKVIDHEPPAVIKDVLAALIDTIHIDPQREAHPVFKVPNTTENRLIVAENTTETRTAVRMESHYVELRGIEPLASSMRPRRSTN